MIVPVKERTQVALSKGGAVTYTERGAIVRHPSGGITIRSQGRELTEDHLQRLHESAEAAERILSECYGDGEPLV